MKNYKNIKMSVSCSIPLGLLMEFDEIAEKKNMKRSKMIVELIKMVVEKEKKEDRKSVV